MEQLSNLDLGIKSFSLPSIQVTVNCGYILECQQYPLPSPQPVASLLSSSTTATDSYRLEATGKFNNAFEALEAHYRSGSVPCTAGYYLRYILAGRRWPS